jgi:hypothetical protein
MQDNLVIDGSEYDACPPAHLPIYPYSHFRSYSCALSVYQVKAEDMATYCAQSSK